MAGHLGAFWQTFGTAKENEEEEEEEEGGGREDEERFLKHSEVTIVHRWY